MDRWERLSRIARAYEADPSYIGHRLRHDFATLVLKEMDDRGISQHALAQLAGMKPSFISRILHGESNCTLDVISRIMTALKITAKLVQVPDRNAGVGIFHSNNKRIDGTDYGEEKVFNFQEEKGTISISEIGGTTGITPSKYAKHARPNRCIC